MKFLGRPENETSWEPEDSLPENVISLFDSQGTTEIKIKETNFNGQLSTTFSAVAKTNESQNDKSPPQKKLKRCTEMPREG